MILKELIRHLKKYDMDKEVVIFEISDKYDTALLAVDDTDETVVLNIKNYKRETEETVH